jgi:hypothetical protein
MTSYRLLTYGQLMSRFLDAIRVVNEIKDEENRRIIMDEIQKHGYFITNYDVNVNDTVSDDDISIVKHKITLPVIISLTTIGNPNDGEGEYRIKGYNDDEMPDWTRYVIYPDKPPSTVDNIEFEIQTDWSMSSRCENEYLATGYCYFYVYSPKLTNDNNKPDKSIYLDYSGEFLGMYIKVGDNYEDYVEDDTGYNQYLGVKFTLTEIYNKDDFSFDTIILIPRVKG